MDLYTFLRKVHAVRFRVNSVWFSVPWTDQPKTDHVMRKKFLVDTDPSDLEAVADECGQVVEL